MKTLKIVFLISIFLSYSTFAKSDVWVDEDGGAVVRVYEEKISIYSLNSFYYFDEIFTNFREGNKELRICIGLGSDGQTGMPSDCYTDLDAELSVYNKGKNRAIHIDMSSYPFLLKAFEDYLIMGEVMRVSIDNFDLFAAYTLHKNNILTPDAYEIIGLPN